MAKDDFYLSDMLSDAFNMRGSISLCGSTALLTSKRRQAFVGNRAVSLRVHHRDAQKVEKRVLEINNNELEYSIGTATSTNNPFYNIFRLWKRSTDGEAEKEIPFILPKTRARLLKEHSGSTGTLTSDSEPGTPVLLQQRQYLFPGVANLGTLKPELYNCPEEGDLAEYPDGHIGRMWFTLEYDKDTEKLTVSIIKVRNLPSREVNTTNACDPFVRVFLLPDERKFVQSKVRRKTTNPKFEESFSFDIASASVHERKLKFVVYDIDNLKRNIPLGRIIYPIKDYLKSKQQRFTTWRDLTNEESESSCNLGEVHCSLCYNGNLERLTVVVIEAKELNPYDHCVELDSYVKVTLSVSGRVVKSKKTRVVRKCFSPVYNESFMFRLAPSKQDLASLSVQVVQCKPDRQIGRIVLGGQMYTKGKVLQHWHDMLAKERDIVQDWHYLTE